MATLEYISYTCGFAFEDLDSNELKLFVKDHDCMDPIEKLYYAARPEDPICIYCGLELDADVMSDEDFYPKCEECPPGEKISKRAV